MQKLDYTDVKLNELKYQKLLKKQDRLYDEIRVQSVMLTSKFHSKKSRHKRKEAIRLLELESYGSDILRQIRKLDKLNDKMDRVQDKLAEYEKTSLREGAYDIE